MRSAVEGGIEPGGKPKGNLKKYINFIKGQYFGSNEEKSIAWEEYKKENGMGKGRKKSNKKRGGSLSGAYGGDLEGKYTGEAIPKNGKPEGILEEYVIFTKSQGPFGSQKAKSAAWAKYKKENNIVESEKTNRARQLAKIRREKNVINKKEQQSLANKARSTGKSAAEKKLARELRNAKKLLEEY